MHIAALRSLCLTKMEHADVRSTPPKSLGPVTVSRRYAAVAGLCPAPRWGPAPDPAGASAPDPPSHHHHACMVQTPRRRPGQALLHSAGRRDIFGLLAKAFNAGRLAPTCILVLLLSDLARNVNVAPKQRRYDAGGGKALEFLASVSRMRCGVSALEALNSSSTNPEQMGWPLPTAPTLRGVIRRTTQGMGGGGSAYLESGGKQVAQHLLSVAAALHERARATAATAGVPPPPQPSELSVRIACDGTACQTELYMHAGRLGGDEDLSPVDPQKYPSPVALGEERKRRVGPLDRTLGLACAPAPAADAMETDAPTEPPEAALAEAVAYVMEEGLPTLEREQREAFEVVDKRVHTYAARQQQGKGRRGKTPAKAAATTDAGGDGGDSDGGEQGMGGDDAGAGGGGVRVGSVPDASGPLACPGSVHDRRTATLLVGRTLHQLFPECALQPSTPYRGRVTELLKASQAKEHRGEVWLKVAYEDGDKEDRELGELLSNAQLQPFAEMRAEERAELHPAALCAELRARHVRIPAGSAKAAAKLVPLLEQALLAADPIDGSGEDAGGDGEGGGGDGGDGDGDECDGDGGDGDGGDGDGGDGDGDGEESERSTTGTAWADVLESFNAKQIAELNQLIAAHGEAAARLTRCRAVVEQSGYSAGEPREALQARLAELDTPTQRQLAISLKQEIEDVISAKRTAADHVIIFRAQDMLHMRPITIARFWIAGTCAGEKMDDMIAFVRRQLLETLRAELGDKLTPRVELLVADKEKCNHGLWEKRPDGQPPTLRALALRVEGAISGARKTPAPAEEPSAEPLYSLDWTDPLMTCQRRADAALLGYDEQKWWDDDERPISWEQLLTMPCELAAALRLGFDRYSWAHASAPMRETAGRAATKRDALATFRRRAPSVLPRMHFDVLGMQLHSLPRGYWLYHRSNVRPCEVEDATDAQREWALKCWWQAECARIGTTEATRARPVRLPSFLEALARDANAMREPRQPSTLEANLPLRSPAIPGGLATLGGMPFRFGAASASDGRLHSWRSPTGGLDLACSHARSDEQPGLYETSRLPHSERFSAVKSGVGMLAAGGSTVSITLNFAPRPREERRGFVTVSQLLTEKRLELAIDDRAVKAADVWEECENQEMHAQRVELKELHGMDFSRRYYIVQDGEMYMCFCESHCMKTGGQGLAGMAGKPEEQVLIKHAHLLEAARSLAAKNREHVPLVAALQKTVDMQSQAVFGNLFSCSDLLDELRARGHWREHVVMRVLGMRWRAMDQREMSREMRTLAIEVLDPLLIANIAGRALFLPGGGGQKRAADGHAPGVRSGHFQGFAWQTLLSRLSNDGLHAHLRETLSPIEALLWCERILAQNDCEGLFGLVCKGLPIKPTPRELGPRFEDAEFLDAMRHDAERALHWLMHESKRKKYDAAELMSTLKEVLAWASGAGDSSLSERARAWVAKQQKGAMVAAAGKQESARTHNTFFADAKRIAAGSKRQRVEGGEAS